MRHLLLLFLLCAPLLLTACGDDEDTSVDLPPPAAEPEVPTPPPFEGDILAGAPQVPLPEGVEPATPRPAELTPGPVTATPEADVPATAPDATDLPPMSVAEAVMGREIVDRQARGLGPFPDGSEVHCFTRIDNPGGGRRTIRHQWFYEGERRSSVELDIKAASWRTWSSRPVFGKGAWRVDVVDEAGVVLKSLPFTVQ